MSRWTKKQNDNYMRMLKIFRAHIEAQKLNIPYNKISDDLNWLHRQETTLSRINDNDANGHPREITEIRDGKKFKYNVENKTWADFDSKKEKRIQIKVKKLLESYGMNVTFNGDPRGAAIQIWLHPPRSEGDSDYYYLDW